jgi:acyl-CoA synthetase (AMP-forming)/AMP-acid ligase II
MTSTLGGSDALANLFDTLLATEPGLPALVQAGRVTTFHDWWVDSSLIASSLAECGVGRGDVVILLLPSGQDFASCYLATLRLGATVSAINPRLGPTEAEHIIGRCEPAAIVTDAPARVAGRVNCPVLTPAGARGRPDAVASVTGWATTPAHEPAVVVWTSGSTGMPKGAWFDHETLAFIAANMGPLSARYDRKLMPIPFAHTAYMTRIYDQLVHRAALVLTPPEWTAATMLEVLAAEHVTVGQGVPTQWEKLIALDRLPETDLSSLRLVSTGASRVPASLVKSLHERLGCAVVVRYASTEVPLAFGTRADDRIEIVATTVGRPLGGAEVEIRAADGSVLPHGETGRVFLRSRARMRGYWRDARATARTIMPDGWLATSDLGRLDPDGNLTIVGRADDAYIRGGYNIYPSEVEAALAAHPRVARVAVVGAPAPVIGEIGVAFVVTDGADGTVTATELQDWCRDRIADYKVPDVVLFMADLPVNATYKVDTGKLRDMATALGSATRRLPRNLLLRCEPLAAVQPDGLAVEHGIDDDRVDEPGVLLRAACPLGKRRVLGQGGNQIVAGILEQPGREQAGSNGHDPYPQPAEIPGHRQAHARDAGLSRGVGYLPDLPLEGGDRRRVDDDAALPFPVRLVLAHVPGLQPVEVERPDQVELDELAEVGEWQRAVAADGALAETAARGVHRDVQAAVRLGRGFQCRLSSLGVRNVTRVKRGGVAQGGRHLRAFTPGQVKHGHPRSPLREELGARPAHAGTASGHDCHFPRSVHVAKPPDFPRCHPPTARSDH